MVLGHVANLPSLMDLITDRMPSPPSYSGMNRIHLYCTCEMFDFLHFHAYEGTAHHHDIKNGFYFWSNLSMILFKYLWRFAQKVKIWGHPSCRTYRKNCLAKKPITIIHVIADALNFVYERLINEWLFICLIRYKFDHLKLLSLTYCEHMFLNVDLLRSRPNKF